MISRDTNDAIFAPHAEILLLIKHQLDLPTHDCLYAECSAEQRDGNLTAVIDSGSVMLRECLIYEHVFSMQKLPAWTHLGVSQFDSVH